MQSQEETVRSLVDFGSAGQNNIPKQKYLFQYTVCVLTVSASKMKRAQDNKTKSPEMKDQVLFVFPQGTQYYDDHNHFSHQ